MGGGATAIHSRGPWLLARNENEACDGESSSLGRSGLDDHGVVVSLPYRRGS